MREKLSIEYMNIQDIQPYEQNAKIHTQEQIKEIKKSIVDFGMKDPIGIWGEKNTIVEGHGRYTACKELGLQEVPVIRLDDLTDEQRRAYTLVHNKATIETGFDVEKLQIELEEIKNIDMGDFGFLQDVEINLDELFTEKEETERKERKQKLCPHCGMPIEN